MKRKFAILAAGIVLAVVCVFIASHESTPIPEYQGKTARQWLRDDLATNPPAAFDAFTQMGSNGVLFLVGELERKDSAWDTFCQWLFPKLPQRIETSLSAPDSQQERWQMASLILQTEDTRGAVPRLKRLLSRGDEEQQRLALELLWLNASPNDTDCIPALTDCLKSTNVVTCVAAADVLARMNSGKLAIAPLTNFLNSTNSMVRLKCLDRLAHIDAANSNEWQRLETNEPAWEKWQQKVRAGQAPKVLLPGSPE